MTRAASRGLVGVMVLAGLVGQAGAHTKSTSYSNWRIEGSVVHLVFTVPSVETARLNQTGETQPPNEWVIHYLSTRLSVSAGGKRR